MNEEDENRERDNKEKEDWQDTANVSKSCSKLVLKLLTISMTVK